MCGADIAARRYLPREALGRATHTEVLAADPGDRGPPHGHFKVRVWVGLLDRDLHLTQCLLGVCTRDLFRKLQQKQPRAREM